MTALCVDQFGAIIGSGFPKSPFDSDSLESYVKYKITGEKWFSKTDLLRQFHFGPEYGNNGYIPEGLLWVGLANKGFKTRYINEIVRKYYVAEGPSIMTNAAFKPNAFWYISVYQIVFKQLQDLLSDQFATGCRTA